MINLRTITLWFCCCIFAVAAQGQTIVAQVKTAAAEAKTSDIIVFKGTSAAQYDGSVMVIYNKSLGVMDSVTVKNGSFEFSVPYKQPSRYMFISNYEKKKKGGYAPYGILVAQPGIIGFKADLETLANSVISNAPDNEIYVAFAKENAMDGQKMMEKLDQKFGAAFMKALTNKDPKYAEVVKYYDELNEPNIAAQEARLITLIKSHPDSFAAIYALNTMMQGLPANKAESLYNMLSPKYKKESIGKGIAEILSAARITAIGKTAPDFEQADTAGKMVKLSGLRGKYVLIDFWASWCGPCRAENPNVVKAYQKYHEKGFTVLGISLDQPGHKEAWLKAIHQDQLTWTQVSDLQFWNNAVAKLYGIRAIPQNFLLDKDGKIIAANIRGEMLDKKLKEIFGE